MAKSNPVFDADELIQSQIAGLDEAIEVLDGRLKKYQPLIDKRNKLMAARRALLGGNRLTGEGGKRLQLEDIIDFLKTNPGSLPSQIAERFGVNQGTVSSHIYRNKGRFRKDKDGGLHNVGDEGDD